MTRRRSPPKAQKPANAKAAATFEAAAAAYHAKDWPRAVSLTQALLRARPSDPAILHLAGVVALGRKDYTAALAYLDKAIAGNDKAADFHSNRGVTLRAMGRLMEAEQSYLRAVELEPGMVQVRNNLGNLCKELWRLEEAEKYYRKAIELAPDYIEAYCNLSYALFLMGRLAESEATARRAIAIDPDSAEGHISLGNALMGQDRIEETEAAFRRGLEREPNHVIAHSNILFCRNYHADLGAEEIFAEYVQWDERQARQFLPKDLKHANDPTPERRLRIGYVSPDFRGHAVSYFFEPLLRGHDREAFEIFLYGEVSNPDDKTEILRSLADHWRMTVGLGDEALADLIRRDGIDVLVDLAGHTAKNRLLTFARKPAPVQVTYLIGGGYTSGMKAMDVFLADEAMVPQGFDHLFSERVVRLPRVPLCYQPPVEMPDVGPLPAAGRGGAVTFGSFSRTARINHRVVALWAEVLRAVPGSRLVLNSRPFVEESSRRAFIEKFTAHGIEADRLNLVFTSPQPNTWAAYNHIDIALDPFPHNAGTTTIEALWMGVPVVSMAARPSVGRFGATILGAVGLEDWVAKDAAEYVRIAKAAAADLPALASLRAALRERFRTSPLYDAQGLAQAMEVAYRGEWRTWCAGRQPGKSQKTVKQAPPAKAPSSPQRKPARSAASIKATSEAMRLIETGQLAKAAQVCETLLADAPDDVGVINILAVVHYKLGNPAAAVAAFRRGRALAPMDYNTLTNFGAALRAVGELKEAEAVYREAIRIAPTYASVHNNLGNLLKAQDRDDEAAEAFRQCINTDPKFVDAYSSLGRILQEKAELTEAERLYKKAIEVNPGHAVAYCNLGVLYMSLNHYRRCEEYLHKAIALDPQYHQAFSNLGVSLMYEGRLAESEKCCRRAIAIKPDYPEVYNNLGIVLQDQGRLADAENAFRTALEIKPDYPNGHGSFLFCLNYRPDLTAEQIFDEYRRWNEAHAKPLLPAEPKHANGRDPNRRLKIGYVSPDFRNHAVSLFFEPILIEHDRSQVEITCYAQVPYADEATKRYQALADRWRFTVGVGDDALAAQIRADGIDVLVDLAGHTANNRLLVFARKPAPVQMSYMVGHGYTTGLTAVDAFLADVLMVPEDADHLFSETVVRLPRTPIAYKPPENMPDVGPLPALANGYVTFGSFSRTVRVNEKVVAAWARLIHAVPNSRLVLNSKPFGEEEMRALFMGRFAEHGLTPEQVSLIYTSPQPLTWDAYNGIDIALDPFPHNAGTTTIEALWMGVPVVSLADRPSVGRFGATILGAVGLEDWVARDADHYVALAVEAASDLPKLAKLRAGLRDRFRASALYDHRGLAREMEAAYRRLWQAWCATGSARASAVPASQAPPPQTATLSAQEAVNAFTAGDLDRADALAAQILAREAGHWDALQVRGLVAYHRGDHAAAVAHLGQAAQARPTAEVLSSLGAALRAAGDVGKAEDVYRRAIALRPDLAGAYGNLGNLLLQAGRFKEAVETYGKALTLAPADFNCWFSLGGAHFYLGQTTEARKAYERALELNPSHVASLGNLGRLHMVAGHVREAEPYLARALQLSPRASQLAHLRIDALARLGRLNEAEDACLRAIEHEPQSAPLHARLGVIRAALARNVDARAACERALELDPNCGDALATLAGLLLAEGRPLAAEARLRGATPADGKGAVANRLGAALMAQCRFDEAEAAFRAALADPVDAARANSNLLGCLEHRPAATVAECVAAYQAWDRPVPGTAANGNDATPGRRLRIGYVVPPPRGRAFARLTVPLLAAHDHDAFEVTVYADRPQPAGGVAGCDRWRSTAGMTDRQMADAVREDAIDVLVDLVGHGHANRLLAFATRPAPVQMALAMGTRTITGLASLDALVADRALMPEGSQGLARERLALLSRIALAFRAPADAPEVGPSPAGRNGFVTFGHVGDTARLNDAVVAAWSRILTQAPGTRLHLCHRAFAEDGMRTRVAGRFAAGGVAADRLIFGDGMADPWAVYGDIDIALDPFPRSGLTGTLDALWMGVPVITLAGRQPVGRFGAAILGALGMQACADEDAYVRAAIEAAADHAGLAAVRGGLRQALAQSPLTDTGGFARAIEDAYRLLWRRWCAARPDADNGYTEASRLFFAGDVAGAQALCGQILQAFPDHANAHQLQGCIHHAHSDHPAAERSFLRAVALRPDVAEYYSNLGATYKAQAKLKEAEESYRKAIACNPNFATGHSNLGNCLQSLGRAREAESAFRAAIAIEPKASEPYYNLGLALQHMGRQTEAEEAYRNCLALSPTHSSSWRNLGALLSDGGDLQAGLECSRRALEVSPQDADAHGSLLFRINYQPELTAEQIFAEYRAWDERHGKPLLPAAPSHANARDPERRLRLGYVSPDFRQHAISFFLEPVLAGHDRGAVEVYCYAEVPAPDDATRRFQALADHWRSTVGLSDDALAALIRKDGIDVLIDLAGHTSGNRLQVFARKPAPVQVAYMIGHGYTTGVSAIDAFLADEAMAPQGSDHLFAERQVIRLPRTPISYLPPAAMPDVGPLPAKATGQVTFASFTRTVRINERVIAAWARILDAVPNSRLMLNNKPFVDAATRAHFTARFGRYGIAPERLTLINTVPQARTWAAYNEVDIALDPFPHNAGTTTIEALWMGVPVVSMADRPTVGRFGATILGAMGMADWVADDEDRYVAVAVEAARDPDRLAALRAGLRQRFRDSPLHDPIGLARAMEGAYRGLWRAWCEANPPPSYEVAGALFLAGDLDGAQRVVDQMLATDPGSGDAYHLAGVIAFRRGDLATAARLLEAALTVMPELPELLSNLGAVYRKQGELRRAEETYRKAIALRPDLGAAQSNLTNVLFDLGRLSEAEEVARRALALNPDSAESYYGLARIVHALSRNGEALVLYRRAIEMVPTYYDAIANMATALMQLCRFDEALIHFNHALELKPTHAEAYNNLGVLYQDKGEFAASEAAYRKAMELRPTYHAAHGNLLFCLNYHPERSAEEIVAEYRRWEAAHARAYIPAAPTYGNDRTPERRLRVGYCSPDFLTHPVRFFLEPLLVNHDRDQVEIFCYAQVSTPDAMTTRFQALADHWRNTVGLGDDAMADLVRQDRIDVLVDLAGHTANNRLLAFARRPAPVQATYLIGHGTTTGLSAIDAFIADAAMAPEGCEHLIAERRVVRLPRTALAFQPPENMPETGPLPARRNGFVTFGHFGRTVRINEKVVAAWAEILNRVPGSRLVLNNKPFAQEENRLLFGERFASYGIAPERLMLIFTEPQTRTWATYHDIDIALDPFPHNAGTTTIEALWMGVPVVSLADRPTVGRFGATILGAVGLGDWVATSAGDYVTTAAAAAADLDALEGLRATLRQKFMASDLYDPKGLTRAMENAYRELWREFVTS